MAKVVGIVILLVGMILVSALIVGTLFLYAGWNWGLVPALEGSKMALREVGLDTAFWLALCLSTIGGFFNFKTSVTTKEN